MPGELERLAEAQRDTVRALAALTEQIGGDAAAEAASLQAAVPVDNAGLQRSIESATQSMRELGAATTANTGAMAELGRHVTALPGLFGGLLGGVQEKRGGIGEFLKGGSGLASLGLKIAGLFRNGGRDEAEPLRVFGQPPSLALEVANTENILAGFPEVARGQSGEARVVERERPVVWQPQVTVNVSAMDSRSFLDHSAEITRAVREAMLHMHPVNDLISEL